ncbi:unnamed protein product [Ixodes hexagonus]
MSHVTRLPHPLEEIGSTPLNLVWPMRRKLLLYPAWKHCLQVTRKTFPTGKVRQRRDSKNHLPSERVSQGLQTSHNYVCVTGQGCRRTAATPTRWNYLSTDRACSEARRPCVDVRKFRGYCKSCSRSREVPRTKIEGSVG